MNRVAYINARLIDPASGWDGPGALFTEGGLIADLQPDDAVLLKASRAARLEQLEDLI